jgi:hypothetical protein
LLILREKRRLCLLENRVLRRISGLKMDERTGKGGGENYIMRSLMICTSHRILFVNQEEYGMGRAFSSYEKSGA